VWLHSTYGNSLARNKYSFPQFVAKLSVTVGLVTQQSKISYIICIYIMVYVLSCYFFFFFHSTAQLQYVEDSEPVTRSMWPLVNSAKTELQVQTELDKKRFLTSAPHGRGATPYTKTVEYQDMIYWEIESLKGTEEVAITIASGRIFQSRTVCG